MAYTDLGKRAETIINNLTTTNVKESWDEFNKIAEEAKSKKDVTALKELRRLGEQLLMHDLSLREDNE